MDFRVLLLCCLLAVTQSRHLDAKVSALGSRIFGGHDAIPGQFPHQVSLQLMVLPNINSSHFCGGTILNEYWILTAAHCVNPLGQIPPTVSVTFIVKAGKHDLSKEEPSEQVAVVQTYFEHEGYQLILGAAINDIALIKLLTPLKLNERVAKAVLPKKDSDPNGQVAISGWGSTSANVQKPVFPTILQTVSVPIIDRKTCVQVIKKLIAETGEQMNVEVVKETNVCTGPLTGGISGCVGDSGGPLISTNDKGEVEVVGIASWILPPCGRKGVPTVFARVSTFIDWIENIINNN